MNAVIASVILLAIVVIGASGAYLWLGGFQNPQPAPAAFAVRAAHEGCHGAFLVASSASGLVPSDLSIHRTSGTGSYLIGYGSHATTNAAWDGSRVAGLVTGGSRIHVWAETPPATFMIAAPSRGVALGEVALTVGGADTSAPWSTLTVPASFTGTLAGLTGTATDTGCGGVATVTATVQDTGTSQYWNGAAFASATAVALATTLTEAGALKSAWTLDTSTVAWQVGSSYAIVATVTDAAGNAAATPPASTTRTA